ncbi:MAG: hypothetical protein KJP21_08120 [Bacteroidia bacterium]|nr:hypothetical protein [Bacteroidia bacterium]NNJ54523.1 hypothetical protein [Bacteroidia bacterium]
MIKNFAFVLVLFLALVSCSRKTIGVPFVKEIDRNELKYTFISSNIIGDSLVAKVQYGGGCIKPHLFELVQTTKDDAGTVYLWLLHKTKDDKCRALVRVSRAYDVSTILKDPSVTSIKLNGDKVLYEKE